MRRWWMLVVGLALVGGVLVGCGLTPEQQKRIAELGEKNEAITVELSDVYAQLKAGTLTPEVGARRLIDLKAALEANASEIKRLRDEGAGTAGMIWAAVGMFGRTALHGAAKAIPAAGPWGTLLSGLLTLLLGGSETKKAAKEPEPAKP